MRRIALAMLLAALSAGAARAVPITICGQTVPDGETGDLANDLVCGSTIGVFLREGATLNLNGFSIVGPGPDFMDPSQDFQGYYSGVFCGSLSGENFARCTINGPGEISNFNAGINAATTRAVTVNDVTVRENRGGLAAPWATKTVLTNVVANDNLSTGILATNLFGTAIEASNNGLDGILAARIRVTGLTATGNGGSGITPVNFLRPARLVDSTLTGNNGLGQGYDIVWVRGVRLVNTRCGKSARLRSRTYQVSGSYGCAGD